jgi:carbon monoxide dehydrogenase subunit G
MADARAETTTTASPDATWTLVGDYFGLADWMPGIDECTADGDDRVLSMMGMTIRERLLEKDDAARRVRYSIVEGAPVETHEATITVHPDGSGSRIVWDVSATPDEMAGMMQGIYQSSLEAVKAKLEG